VTDDKDGSDILSPAPRRRIPLYVSIAVVLACGLIGYGLSLAVPLHRAPVPAAPAASVTKPEPAKGAEVKPARHDSSIANSGSSTPSAASTTAAPEKSASPTPAASADPSTRLGRVDPAAAKAPEVETGSVEHSAKRAAVPPAAAEPQGEAADSRSGAKQAQPPPRRKVRRVYRPRAQPKTAKGPFEQLFPALVK
jgi:hypothetical protein